MTTDTSKTNHLPEWRARTVPTVTTPSDGSQPARCTCAEFLTTGACPHTAEAHAMQARLDADAAARVAAMKAEIFYHLARMTDEQLVELERLWNQVDRSLWGLHGAN